MTHLCSGHEQLINELMKNPHFDHFETKGLHHYDDFQILFNNPHRKNDKKAVWGTTIFHNQDLTCFSLIKHCNFIYYSKKYDPSMSISALSYRYRITGMKIWHNRTGGEWLVV